MPQPLAAGASYGPWSPTPEASGLHICTFFSDEADDPIFVLRFTHLRLFLAVLDRHHTVQRDRPITHDLFCQGGGAVVLATRKRLTVTPLSA